MNAPTLPARTAIPVSLMERVRRQVRSTVPLPWRMRAAVLVGRSGMRGADWWAGELVSDMAERDLNAYHRFLWSHHLGYARSYTAARFATGGVLPSRRLFFAQLAEALRARGAAPERDVRSVLEVGCSMGYLLRHVETELFHAAEVLHGVDIDRRAVRQGARLLSAQRSAVRLWEGDAADDAGMDRMGEPRYDVVFCAGVLMYLQPRDAQRAVAAMLARTDGILALAGLAHPAVDNRELRAAVQRPRDRSLIHNLDAMVAAAGGTVFRRCWEGPRQLDGNTIYFVFAEPAGGARWAR